MKSRHKIVFLLEGHCLTVVRNKRTGRRDLRALCRFVSSRPYADLRDFRAYATFRLPGLLPFFHVKLWSGLLTFMRTLQITPGWGPQDHGGPGRPPPLPPLRAGPEYGMAT